MAQEGDSFGSLNALRRHWAKRASQKRSSAFNGLPDGRTGQDVQIRGEGPTSASLEARLSQAKLRDDPSTDSALDTATGAQRRVLQI